jgi:hypothetical protein
MPAHVPVTELVPGHVYYSGSTCYTPRFTAVRIGRVNKKAQTCAVEFLGAVDHTGKPTDDDVQAWTNWRPPSGVLLYPTLDDAATALAIDIEQECHRLREELKHIEAQLPALTAWLRGDSPV